MPEIFHSRFYGDPADVVDELRAMRKQEAEWLANRSAAQVFKANLKKDLTEWRVKNVGIKSNKQRNT